MGMWKDIVGDWGLGTGYWGLGIRHLSSTLNYFQYPAPSPQYPVPSTQYPLPIRIFAPNNAVPSLRLVRRGKSGLQWAPHPVKSGGFMPETA